MADYYVSSVAWTALPQFAASHAYSIGDIIRPLTTPANGHEFAFRCTTAGTSSTEPATWNIANNSTTVSGGATFTNVSGQSTYGWGAAIGTLFALGNAVSNRVSPGDRVFISSDSNESFIGSALGSWGFCGAVNQFGLIQVISVNRAGSVPPVAADVLSGAAITYTASGGGIAVDAYCDMFWQGISFTLAGTVAAGAFEFNSTGTKSHYFKNCALSLNAGATSRFVSAGSCRLILDNTTLGFGASGQTISVTTGPLDVVWLNTASAVTGTLPSSLFNNGAQALTVTCRGVDLSAVTGTLLTSAAANQISKVLLDSCKIASAVTRLALGSSTTSPAGDEIELVNCYDGTNVVNERHTAAGDLTFDRSTYLTGGAQDDAGNYSLKLASSARSDFMTMPLDGFWLDVENTAIGASKTATVEIVSSAALNNTDIKLLLEYMGTSGSPVADFLESLSSALAASSTLASSSSTWNSPPSTPQKQLLQVTFTPQVAGRVRGLVRLGKISTTCWVDPRITVT